MHILTYVALLAPIAMVVYGSVTFAVRLRRLRRSGRFIMASDSASPIAETETAPHPAPVSVGRHAKRPTDVEAP